MTSSDPGVGGDYGRPKKSATGRPGRALPELTVEENLKIAGWAYGVEPWLVGRGWKRSLQFTDVLLFGHRAPDDARGEYRSLGGMFLRRSLHKLYAQPAPANRLCDIADAGKPTYEHHRSVR